MFFRHTRAALQQAQNDNTTLQQENRQLQARLAALEGEHTSQRTQLDTLTRERAMLQGVFANIGSFGNSLGGVQHSFQGLAGSLGQERTPRTRWRRRPTATATISS